MVRLPDDSPLRRKPTPTSFQIVASVFERLDAAFGGLTEACGRLRRAHQEQRLARVRKLQAQQARRRRKRRARK